MHIPLPEDWILRLYAGSLGGADGQGQSSSHLGVTDSVIPKGFANISRIC